MVVRISSTLSRRERIGHEGILEQSRHQQPNDHTRQQMTSALPPPYVARSAHHLTLISHAVAKSLWEDVLVCSLNRLMLCETAQAKWRDVHQRRPPRVINSAIHAPTAGRF